MPYINSKFLLTFIYLVILLNSLKSQNVISTDCNDSLKVLYEPLICDTCILEETVVFLQYGFEGYYELFINEQKIYEGFLKTNQSTSIAFSTLIKSKEENMLCIKTSDGCVIINLNENYKTVIISWFPKFWDVKFKISEINFE